MALARALATDPAALLLDEPFAALDAPLRRVLRRELQTLRHRFGFAVLLVTHDLGDACALGDRIAVVAGGEIVQVGTPEEVLTRPATPLVARLTGLRNVFPARVVRVLPGALEVQTGRFTVRTPPFPFPAGAPVFLYIRPDAVALVRPGDVRQPEDSTLLRGRIVDDQYLGPLHTLYVRLLDTLAAPDGAGAPYDLEVDIAAHPYRALGVDTHAEWTLALPFEALHVTAGAPDAVALAAACGRRRVSREGEHQPPLLGGDVQHLARRPRRCPPPLRRRAPRRVPAHHRGVTRGRSAGQQGVRRRRRGRVESTIPRASFTSASFSSLLIAAITSVNLGMDGRNTAVLMASTNTFHISGGTSGD